MIALDSGDKIRGDASAATVVDYTLHGLDNNAIKQLADGQLASSIGDLYTADSADVVSTITLVNTDTSARTVNLYLTPSGGTARRIIPKDCSLGVGYSLHTDGLRVYVLDASGQIMESYGTHKDSHDPNDGSDPLDSANASEIAGVQAAGTGTSHSLARADHAHQIQHGIADNHLVTVDQADAASGEYVRMTASGIESRSEAEAKADLNLEIGTDVLAEQTIGIADDNLVEIDGADVADDEYARFTANGLESRTAAEVMADLPAASDSVSGRVELATIAETNTGTDTGRSVTPDGLAGSIFGEKLVYIKVLANDTALTTGDGKAYFTIPDALNGMNLVDADAAVYTASSSGTPTIQIHNLTDTADMLSTLITIDANEYSSYTAATPPVINGAADDVATGDRIRIDVDVAGTGTAGLDVILTFQLP